MMGRQCGQISMLVLDIEELIPERKRLLPASFPGNCSSLHRIETDKWPRNGLRWQLYSRRRFQKQLD